MKRTILTLLLAMSALHAMAQGHLDTIDPSNWRHYQFNYKWWDDPDTMYQFCHIVPDVAVGGGPDWQEPVEVVEQRITGDTLRVIGLAGCAHLYELDDCMLAGNSRDDDDEYLRLYKPVGSGLSLEAEGLYNVNRDTAYLLAGLHQVWYDGVSHGQEYYYLPTYEVYFDTTHLIADTFYVGTTMHNNWRDHENGQLWPTWPVQPYSIIKYANNEGAQFHLYSHGKVHYQDTPTTWTSRTFEGTLCVWPILEDEWPEDKRCPEPTNLSMIAIGDCGTFTWDGPSNQTQWQVSYGEGLTEPDSGRIVDLGTNYWHHCFEDSTEQHVYVRGYCHNERCWSRWVGPMVHGTAAEDTTTSEGVRGASTVESQTRVYPNPATSSVTVTSGYTLERLEVSTLQGQLLQGHQARGHAATLDVSGLEPGVYLLIVHTAHGRTAKRLVIR